MKLNARGQGLAGIAGQQSSVDGLYLPVLGNAAWLDDDTVIGQSLDGQRVIAVRLADLAHPDPVASHGASLVVGGGGRWASFLQPPIGPSQVDGSLGPLDGAYVYACGPDGTIAWKRVYQSGGGLTLSSPDGTVVDVADADPIEVQVLGPGLAVWRESAVGVFRAVGRAVPVPAVPAARLRLVTVDGEDWLIIAGQNGGLFAQVDGQTDGYVLVPPGGLAYTHDARVVNGAIAITWATGAGERPQDVQRCTVDRTQPRVPLASAAVSLTPVGRACAVGFFAFGDRGTAPGNAILDVATGHVVRADNGEVLAQYAAAEADGTIAGLDAAVAAKHAADPTLAVLAYWPRGLQAGRAPAGAEVVGIEAYQGLDESLEVFERRLRASAAKCTFAILIGQAYTSNGSQTEALVPLVPVYARVLHDVATLLGILAFSAGARATGWNDHPEIHAAWSQLATSVTGLPPFPQPHVAPSPMPEPKPEPPTPSIPEPVHPPQPDTSTTSAAAYLLTRTR